MNISNQKPVKLSPVYKHPVKGVFDPTERIREIMAEPLFTPLSPNQPVSITSNSKQITDAFITDRILACCDDMVDATAETFVKTLYGQTLMYFNPKTTLAVQDVFMIQAATEEKLPDPSQVAIYTPSMDVIPSCKEFIAGKCSYEKFFASLGFFARPETLGFYFIQEKEFDDFKDWLAQQVQPVLGAFPAETNQLLSQFQSLKLNGLTESITLRANDSDNNDEYSFARIIVYYLMEYTNIVSNGLFGVLPFNIGELFCPKTLVFVNVAKHARAAPKEITDEWQIINQSLQNPVKMISQTKLQKLTTLARSVKKIQSQAATAQSNQHAQAIRAATRRFRKQPPNTTDIVRIIKKVMEKMVQVNRSNNVYKVSKTTFAKPNRRDPDDFNKMGKMVSTKYKPDLHIYLDTSGSISEQNYQAAVEALIRMARRLNINLYFNSFSHVLSQCTLLKTKDKSPKEVYAAFQKVPKVSGGTDFEQIWHYINKSPKRKRELSLLLTDFEYYAPNRFVEHPKNLYYLPYANMDWKRIVGHAESFCDSMTRIDPNCRNKILF